MDNLVLIRVAEVYDRSLRGAVLCEFREEAPDRFRLVFALGERPRSILISVEPDHPWTGRPATRAERDRRAPGPFAAVASRALHGGVVSGVEKRPADRAFTVRFADGQRLVAELVPRRANLVLVDPRGMVAAARRPGKRCHPGTPHRPFDLPRGRLDPFEPGRDRLEARLRADLRAGATVGEVLREALVGVGPTAADLVAREARETDRSAAAVLLERLALVAAAGADPVLETWDPDPLAAALEGRLDPDSIQLLPWAPPWAPPAGRLRLALEDAALTSGVFHSSLEVECDARRQIAALRAVLDREVDRLAEVGLRVASDAASFEDPDRFRRWGEALLAGITRARRAGAHVLVPDPYDPQGHEIPVPVSPAESPSAAAARHFAMHRRARRGLERAAERRRTVAERRARLIALRERPAAAGPEAVRELAGALQAAGIPVGLASGPGARSAVAEVRIEGVRLYVSRDGETVLVGKSARDNHRLTFRIATPEDFWFHARCVPGAHVVVRNPRRAAHPPPATLEEAAAAAAYYSEAREQPAVDVQWTRRKYVRKLRGAPPGTVAVKRSTTVRVRPRRPAALEADS